MSTVYLLHFDPPYHHARHYLGFTDRVSLRVRVEEHLNGKGAALTIMRWLRPTTRCWGGFKAKCYEK